MRDGNDVKSRRDERCESAICQDERLTVQRWLSTFGVMRGALTILVSGLVAGHLGCAAATQDQLVRRASFDLDCGPNTLRYHEIDYRTRGVTGCGKRATYVESCDGPRNNAMTSCTWVLNGQIEKPQRASAGPADPEATAGGPGSGSSGESTAPR